MNFDELDGRYGFLLAKENPTPQQKFYRNYVRQRNAQLNELQGNFTKKILKNHFSELNTALQNTLEQSTRAAIDKILEEQGFTVER